MSKFELLTFPDDLSLARAAADRWLTQLKAATLRSETYCVALSGGRIARRFFEQIVRLPESQRAPLLAIHFFWGDERCVPPTDPESNFGMAKQLLLTPLGIPDNQIHRIIGEAEPGEAAIMAEADLRRIAQADAAGNPVLDLIFLGMGEDGHTASLFPGEPEEAMNSTTVFRPVTATKPPPHRITIGYSTIAAARETWVLASGPDKTQPLDQSLKSEGQTPLARVLTLRSSTKIFTDILK